MTRNSQDISAVDRAICDSPGEASSSRSHEQQGPPPKSAVELAHGVTRREWLVAVPVAAALASSAEALAISDQTGYAASSGLHSEFPSHDPSAVREVVGASHTRIDRVRVLVEASPALAKATWDWGFGDWESALGAASHMGRRDIAQLLIDHGARPNLFTFAMLGHLSVVEAYVEAMPGIQRIPGPHGITLLEHARKGGNAARRVAAYLESLGDADDKATSLEVSDDEKNLYVGRYTFGTGADEAFEGLTNRRGALAIQRGERFSRVLNRVEKHGFAPGGAPAVRVRFDIKDGRAVSLTIHDPVPLVKAVRSN